MARKKEILIYEFDELSDEAKEKAIELLIDDGKAFTDSDAEDLSDLFEEDLENHYGLGEMEVCWSLSYTQGDGVAFWGKVDVEKFVATELEKNPKPGGVENIMRLVPLVRVKIDHVGRYCHSGSMNVEFDLLGGPEDLIPDPTGQEYMEWLRDSRAKMMYWQEEKARIMEARRNPVAYWEQQKERWERKKLRPFEGKPSPKAWAPGEPGPMPEELDLEIPPEPREPMPSHLVAALRKAEGEWQGVEADARAFEYFLKERVREISHELEETGYAEIDYLRSLEFMEQRIEDRGWTFLEDGRRYKE